MLDSTLRQWKETCLRPLLRGPISRLHPDQLTRAACVLGLLAAAAAALSQWTWALVFWLLNRFLDGLDGSLARERGLQSDWGGYQDIVLDHVIYASIPLGVATATGEWQACAFLQAAYFLNTISWSYLAALLEKRASGAAQRGEMTSVTMPAALIEGTETLVFFCLFLGYPNGSAALFLLKGLLVLVGVWQRWQFARSVLK